MYLSISDKMIAVEAETCEADIMIRLICKNNKNKYLYERKMNLLILQYLSHTHMHFPLSLSNTKEDCHLYEMTPLPQGLT